MGAMNRNMPNEPPHKLMLRFVFGAIFFMVAITLLSYFILSLLFIKNYFNGNYNTWMPPLNTVIMEAVFSFIFGILFLALAFYVLKPYIELAMKGSSRYDYY